MSAEKRTAKPQSKKVATLLEQLQRRRGVRNLAKRFLIVCEDGKSAPNYFIALKAHFNLSATSIEVAGSGGRSQPIQVVERAIQMKIAAARKSSGTLPFAEVWCVIDGDYGDKIANARDKANANGVKLAISTMCFEHWVLLHFGETDTARPDCDGVIHRLNSSLKKAHLPDYEKGKFDFRDIVSAVHDAASRARKLRKPGIDRGCKPEDQNPCSEVYKLVDEILDACP